MTPTWPSIAAGGRPALLAGWLRRARAIEATAPWVLRGSLVTAALCPGARPPADVDYLLPGDAGGFAPEAIAATVRGVAAVADATTTLEVEGTEVIWAETSSPGLRAFLVGDAGTVRGHRFQVDLAVGDPMCVPPRPLAIAAVGEVRACAPETLFGWKLHGLCEFGPGKWRAKDLFDLDLLWRHAGLDLAATRAAVALAFSSRGLPLTALDDFRTRESWGTSRGGTRKWRTLGRAHPVDDLLATRARVRAAVDVILG